MNRVDAVSKWLFMVCIGWCLTSCDVIDPDKARELPAPVDTAQQDSTLPGEIAMVRRVLLYDFTGHTCGNCPAGHEAANKLKETYGDRLLIMNVHCGFFAEPKEPAYQKFTADYRN